MQCAVSKLQKVNKHCGENDILSFLVYLIISAGYYISVYIIIYIYIRVILVDYKIRFSKAIFSWIVLFNFMWIHLKTM